MKRKTLAVGTTALLALGLAFSGAQTASAHTPEVSSTCEGLTVNLTNYATLAAVPATTKQKLVKEAVPAVPAVTEQKLVKAAVEAKDAVYKTVVVKEAVSAVPAVYKTVVVAPAIEAQPAVTEERLIKEAVAAQEAVYETVIVTPATPAVPATYKTVVVTPAIPAVPAKPAITQQIEVTWKWWGPVNHGKTIVTDGSYPTKKQNVYGGEWKEQSRKTIVEAQAAVPAKPAVPAVTKQVEATPAIPAKPAVTEQKLVKEAVAAQDAVYETVVVKEAVEAQPEITREELVTEAIEAEPEVTEEVLVTEAVEAEDAVYETVEVTPAVPAQDAVYETVEDAPAVPGNETPNTVTVTINGEVVEDTTFGTTFEKYYKFGDKYVANEYTVSVVGFDGQGTKDFTGTSTPCEKPPVVVPPTTEPPVTTPPVVVPPVTTPPVVAIPVETCATLGRVNVPKGDVDYTTALDGDNDGVACDSIPVTVKAAAVAPAPVAAKADSADALAFTGSDYKTGGILAAILLALGAGFTFLARRKTA